MAKVEAWYEQDLKRPVRINYLDGSFFNQDAAGSRIGVKVYSDGQAVTLAGSITGYCVQADGTTVPISGTRSGNTAYIDIPQSALSVPGPLTVTIKNTESSVITTLCAVVGIVTQSRTGVQVDPGQTVTDWTNQISAQLQACQTAADNVGAIVAVPYANLTFPVEVNTYTTYNGNLYCCTTRIATSESFTAAHWRQTNVCREISDLKSAFDNAVFTGDNNLIDSKVIYKSGNNAVTNNNDGTYTIGTTDYGSTVFDKSITLKPGTYLLFGVANGYSYLSTIAHKNGAFVKNYNSSPLTVVINNEITCYVGFNIDAAPSSAFIISPFLYETIMEKNKKSIEEINEKIPDNEVMNYIGQATGTTIVSNETPGWYSVDSSILENFTDLPENASVGIVVNISRAGNSSKRYVKQFYINAIDGKTWERLLINGTAYNSWVRYILGSEYDDFISNVLKYNGIVNGTTLVDNLATGWYSVNSSAFENITDAPDGAEIGTLLNIPRSGNTSANNIRQFYINAFNGRMWSRHIANGSVFRNWQCVGAGSYNVIWYALGDSITAGVYSNDQGESVTVYNPDWAYPNQVARDYKCTVHNLGNPGKAITEYQSILSNIHSDATLITITGGANDYANETNPLGDVNSAADYTTVCGALKSIIETVASTAPNARIVLISPWLIKYGSLSTKWSLNYAVSNKGNFTYDQLSDAMKAIAEYYNIEFIDGTHEGPVNILNIGDVLKDNVHPTKVFYDTISNWIGSKLF